MCVFEKMLQYSLTLYYKDNLDERRTFFCYKLPISTIMKWTNKPISKPLTRIIDIENQKLAVSMFKSIFQ
jgi:hypothetical protein